MNTLIKLSNYQIDKTLYTSEQSIVCRGIRQTDEQTVILKVLREQYPASEKIVWFKREFEITRSLQLDGVVDVYSLEHNQSHWIMVMEDFGGQSLAQLMRNSLGKSGFLIGNSTTTKLETFFAIAIQIVDILGDVHQQHVIHKDINPANIVFNINTQKIKLIDFGISTVLSTENPSFRSPNVLEGTLPYISPEQTGRMNRSLDYRTDFYSLGVTFYELLTGQLPFNSNDALEIVHSHIAKQPPFPHQVCPYIPIALSNIILKLMAKNAEDRYQSAFGLKADLKKCLAPSPDSDVPLFELGQQDVSNRFQIPQKLYGREHEIEALLNAFQQATTAKSGRAQLFLVTGYPGIGKSALVQEVYKPITKRRGYFISGKFDQFQRNIPYFGLIQAFQGLIRQLLTESDAEIAAWREKIQGAVGPNGQVLVDVIPEVTLIIGPQPPIPTLGALEAQNRFNLVLQNFIKLFTQPEHPLTIFIDDLQWADGASLSLIELLLTAQDNHHLFLIGAYRHNEINGHPLLLTLKTLEAVNVPLNQVQLSPLNLENVCALLADTLHSTPQALAEMAELVLEKTGGNPFFLNQFLKALYVDGLITFNNTMGQWEWDLAEIRKREITANVVDLMANTMQRLPLKTQTCLQLAACIGNQFDLLTLALIAKEAPQQTVPNLTMALKEGLITPLSEAYKLGELAQDEVMLEAMAEKITYKFAHDRIQQAAYSLISAEERAKNHYEIGRLLLKNIPPEEQAERIFDIVNQVNLGQTLLTTEEEQLEIAELNLLAGKKAKNSAAYKPALNYLQTGLELLATIKRDSWRHFYQLTLTLYTEAAETAYLGGEFEQMARLNETVLAKTTSLLDQVKIYEIQIQAYTAQSKPLEAVKRGLEVLQLFEINMPQTATQLRAGYEFIKIKFKLRNKNTTDLLNLPQMTDPHQLAVMRILAIMAVPTTTSAPEMFALIVLREIELSVEHGNAPVSCFAYSLYGLFLCGLTGEIEKGHEFGILGIQLAEKLNLPDMMVKVTNAYNTVIRHWKHHAQETVPALSQNYQQALNIGDLEGVALAGVYHAVYAFFVGQNLATLMERMLGYYEMFGQINQQVLFNYLRLAMQVVANLRQEQQEGSSLYYLHGEYYNETIMLTKHQQSNDNGGIFFLHFNKMVLCYLLEAHQEAVIHAAISEKYKTGGIVGLLHIPLFHFYDSLAHLAVYPKSSTAEQKRILKRVIKNKKQMSKWAQHAPMNYRSKLYLMEAERFRVLGRAGAAREHYDQAIGAAHQHQYLNDEALAQELAGRFYLGREQRQTAILYLQKAHYNYQQWGAVAKASQMRQKYSFLQINQQYDDFDLSNTPPTLTTPSSPSSTRAGGRLDFVAIIRASEAIFSEIELDKLLTKLMRLVIESAGAERGFLLLPTKKQRRNNGFSWTIEAQGHINSDNVKLESLTLSENLLPMPLVNYVNRTRETVVLNDATHEGDFTQNEYILRHHPKSILCMPLVNQGNLTLILYLENNLATGVFTPERLKLLTLLSSHVAIATENARLYGDLEASERKYRTIFEESRDMIFISALDGRIDDVSPACLQLLGYPRDELLGTNVLHYYKHPEVREQFIAEINKNGAVKDFELMMKHRDGTLFEALVTATVREGDDQSVIGYQGIVRDISAQRQAEQERMKLLAIQQELSIAHDIQESLLPPFKPNWTDIEVICYSSPAREVGGDFYIYHQFPTSNSQVKARYGLAVGDVSGKGVSAALLMATSYSQFDAALVLDMTPRERMLYLDRIISPYTKPRRQNCAMCYIEIELGSPETDYSNPYASLKVVNAGCIPPYIKRASGLVEDPEIGGFALGQALGGKWGYQEVEILLEQGDIIILSSDGVVEANNQKREMFGFQQLKQTIATGPTKSAEMMLQHLQKTVRDFVQDAEQHDDLTMVVIQM